MKKYVKTIECTPINADEALMTTLEGIKTDKYNVLQSMLYDSDVDEYYIFYTIIYWFGA